MGSVLIINIKRRKRNRKKKKINKLKLKNMQRNVISIMKFPLLLLILT